MAPQQSFLPSRDGFAFTNSWPPAPAVSMATAFGEIDIGNAKDGLCGGMVFAALDYWYAGVTPAGAAAQAQVAALQVPGPPDHRLVARAGRRRPVLHLDEPPGRRRRASRPSATRSSSSTGCPVAPSPSSGRSIRSDLDRGIPCALGLVTVASHNPADLGLNHQVLAYGYDVDRVDR